MAELDPMRGHRGTFYSNLPDSVARSGSPVELRLLNEYGAVFLARGGVIPPDRVIFRNENEVADFQSTLEISREIIGGFEMELQSTAMEALQKAAGDAEAAGLSITPRGPDSARRNYNETVGLWNSRVEPALHHWVAQGNLSSQDSERISLMSTFEQVTEVLKLEEEGIFFAKDLSKSILYSVAPPGASQHLAMLAFDVAEFSDPQVREILAGHRWYRTVVSDLPHFTYLGIDEEWLLALGLKQIAFGEQTFWVPDIAAAGGT